MHCHHDQLTSGEWLVSFTVLIAMLIFLWKWKWK